MITVTLSRDDGAYLRVLLAARADELRPLVDPIARAALSTEERIADALRAGS